MSFGQQRGWEPSVRAGKAVSSLFKHQHKEFKRNSVACTQDELEAVQVCVIRTVNSAVNF